jgi:hypothetical protein
LREVAAGMVGLSDTKETVRINHLKKEHFMDANKIRKVEFFEEIIITYSKNIYFVGQSNRGCFGEKGQDS